MYLLKLIKLSLNGCILSYIDYVFKVNFKMVTCYLITPVIKKWDLFPLLESGWSYAASTNRIWQKQLYVASKAGS